MCQLIPIVRSEYTTLHYTLLTMINANTFQAPPYDKLSNICGTVWDMLSCVYDLTCVVIIVVVVVLVVVIIVVLILVLVVEVVVVLLLLIVQVVMV